MRVQHIFLLLFYFSYSYHQNQHHSRKSAQFRDFQDLPSKVFLTKRILSFPRKRPIDDLRSPRMKDRLWKKKRIKKNINEENKKMKNKKINKK